MRIRASLGRRSCAAGSELPVGAAGRSRHGKVLASMAQAKLVLGSIPRNHGLASVSPARSLANAVKFTPRVRIACCAYMAKPRSLRRPQAQERRVQRSVRKCPRRECPHECQVESARGPGQRPCCHGERRMKGCIEMDLASRAQPVVDALRSSGRSVVTAESCTAGLLAAVLSHAEAASECLHGGFVVYTKAQKQAALGVEQTEMQLHGAVNGEVAKQMAEGALHRSPATVAVSITGVLGPNPDEDGSPPGLVYLGLAEAGKPTITVRHDFGKVDPDYIRKETVSRALDMLLGAARNRP